MARFLNQAEVIWVVRMREAGSEKDGFPQSEGLQQLEMLGSLNSMLSKLGGGKLVSSVTENYMRLKDKVLRKIVITEILPQLFHIDYPQAINADQLAAHIAASPYQVWNISEYPYDDGFEQALRQKAPNGHTHRLCFQLYSNLPFFELTQAVGQIRRFLETPSHKVYLHCQDSKLRSAVFLSAYLFLTRSTDITEAIELVNHKLGLQMEESSAAYSNQHKLFRNLVNFRTDPACINPHQLFLEKVLITHAPRLDVAPPDAILKVVVEVRQGEEVAWRGMSAVGLEGGGACVAVGKVAVSDEFLVIVKYVWAKKVFSIMRIQLNSNFIFQQFARAHQQDVDLSAHARPLPHPTCVDFLFQQHTELSKLAAAQNSNQQQKEEIEKQKQREREREKEESVDLLGAGVEGRFALEGLEEAGEMDENELNLKIAQVMKSMTLKEEQQLEDHEEEEEDLDDYLSKLEEQAQ